MSLTYDERFAKWMATPPQDTRLIEGIYIYGNTWVGTRRYARGLFEAANYPDENGTLQTWGPLNFELQLPEQRNSLQLDMTISIDGVGPEVIEAFDRIPPENLAQQTWIKLYSWIEPTAVDVPLITPPPRFVMDEVILSATSVELNCSGPLLPNWRAGEIYTIEDYPGLSTE